MNEEGWLKRTYNRICELLSVRKISWVAVFLFVLMLVPVISLSFVNRASGDDYGYGAYTRAAWLSSHSLIAVCKAAWRTIRQYYFGWQGTWFSIFVFSLQPEVFSDKAYVIVVFLMLFLWIGSTFLLFKELLVRKMHLEKWSYLLITVIFLVISMQFIPSTKSAIFWFNGCAHYMLPFTMCQLLIYWLLRFCDAYKVKYLIGICILMTLLGGSNYQAALFALIVAFYAGIADLLAKKNKRIFLLVVPVVLELIGLLISMKAPGNKIRGGEEFGLSIGKAAATVGLSFVEGFRTVLGYVQEKPLVFVGLLLMFLFMLEAMARKAEAEPVKHPILSVIALICLYSAMQAPALYAGVEVSGGVYNMNYQTFLLMMGGILLILAEVIVKYLRSKEKASSVKIHNRFVIPGIVLCMFLAVVCRSNIKDSTSFKCLDYIVTGQAADFKEQMDLQTRILLEEEQNVVLPFINDVQGPLMHMPVTADPEAFTNSVAEQFYEKESVVAMPRPEWEEKYGDKWQKK